MTTIFGRGVNVALSLAIIRLEQPMAVMNSLRVNYYELLHRLVKVKSMTS